MFTDPVAAPNAIEFDAASTYRRSLSWATWNAALLLLGATFLLRFAYLAFLSPYELVGDEAYYWEQSRHLSGSYNEKGPALPLRFRFYARRLRVKRRTSCCAWDWPRIAPRSISNASQ